jgi:hypothetical protein
MDTANRTVRTAERARRGAHHAIEDLSNRVVPMIDRLSRRGHALVERAAIGASDAADAVVRGRSNLSVMRRAAVGRCRDFVRDHPLATMAAAAVAGAVVYGIWRARRG